MEKILKDELKEGEQLLWSAKPEEFETLDTTHKQPLIKKAVIICSVAIALSVLYIVFASTKGIDLKLGLVAILLIGAAIASVNGFLDGKKIRKLTYVITNQRLMVVSDVIKSVEYDLIKEAEFKTDADGHTSLLCGKKAIEAKAHIWRMFTIAGAHIEIETGLCDSFAFYAIPDAERVKKILSDFIPL